MFANRLALAIALLAGLIGSQGPEFAQQYRQRLGGAVAELDRIVAEFDAEAQRENLTPAEGLSRLEENADSLARQRGEAMAETIDRATELKEQLQAMTTAGPLTRLYVMAKDFDRKWGAPAAHPTSEPATPLTFEALTRRRPRRCLGLARDAPRRVAAPAPLASSSPTGEGRNRLVGHEHRQGLLTHEIDAHPAEQPFVEPGMTKRAGNDEIGVLRVEARKQRLDRRQIAGVRPVRDMLGLDAVRGQVIDQHLG